MYNNISQWYIQFIASDIFKDLWIPAIVVFAVYLVYKLIRGAIAR